MYHIRSIHFSIFSHKNFLIFLANKRYRNFICLLFVSFLFIQPAIAQGMFTVSGYIRDAKTGEDLIGATVSVKELSTRGSATNAYGFYSLTLPSGQYQVTTQYMGYDPQIQQVDLTQPRKIDFLLESHENALGEVVVTSQRKNDNITKLEMGVQKLDTKDIKNIPVLFGEKDILKTIQLLPGIKSAGEGSSGFNVHCCIPHDQ